MLIRIDNEIKDYKCLGEVWNILPMSIYSDLIPSDFKIKCYNCNHIFTKEEIEPFLIKTTHNGRSLTIFKISDCPKCHEIDLEWNVIL